jgi:hypothetical protein
VPAQDFTRKEVITVEYRKPELLLVGRAAEEIQSNLDKTSLPPDAQNIDFPSAGAAYEADE